MKELTFHHLLEKANKRVFSAPKGALRIQLEKGVAKLMLLASQSGDARVVQQLLSRGVHTGVTDHE